MFKNMISILVVAGLVFALSAAPQQADAGFIYQESFADDTGGPNLHGTKPNDAGTETWVADTAWSETGNKTTTAVANAFLPFSPVAGNVYTLAATLNPDFGTTTKWIGLGFTANNTLGIDFWMPPNNAAPWVLFRDNDAAANVITTFTGPGVTGPAAHDLTPDKVGAVEFAIELDTTAAAWTVEWFEDGNSLGTHTYTTNPTITHVGFGALANTGSVSDFSLTPEPATMSLLALGGLAILRRRRRTRA